MYDAATNDSSLPDFRPAIGLRRLSSLDGFPLPDRDRGPAAPAFAGADGFMGMTDDGSVHHRIENRILPVLQLAEEIGNLRVLHRLAGLVDPEILLRDVRNVRR